MCKFLLFSLLFVFFPFTDVPAETTTTPEQIAEFTYKRNQGDDMQMRGIMELIGSNGQIRSREFISFRKDSNGERKQLIRFLTPPDIEGTAFLTLETEQSNQVEQHLYLPALQRTRRIVASQKNRSFVNSDFTYEDMQRQPVEDWSYQLLGKEKLFGRATYILESTPKRETETQYSKQVSWIDQEYFMPLKTLFYDSKGLEVKRYTVLSFQIIDKIPTETEVLMENLLTEHKTRLKTLEINYNTGLPDSLFTTRALEQ